MTQQDKPDPANDNAGQEPRAAAPCAICGKPVDKDAPPRTKWSPSVDHIVSPLDGGHGSDRRGLRLTHYSCNSRKGRGRTVIVPKVSRNL